jgi:hypothetical protein
MLNSASHLKKISCLLQSCIAVCEQGTHFSVVEKFLDFVSFLLGLNKGMYLVENPE